MSEKTYNVSFFTPKSAAAKANMKMVVIMLCVWAIAVFGFQFLLIAMNKKVAEPVLANFEKAWPSMKKGTATNLEQQEIAKVILQVLGKNVALKDKHKIVLKNSLSAIVYGLGVQGINAEAASKIIGLGNDGYEPLFAEIMKSSLVTVTSATLTETDKKELPKIMKTYLIHNRSVLTDTPFLGFPFHYWYTAQFLLILFVGLCWLFCFLTDRSNRKFNLETGNEDDAPAEEEPATETEEKKGDK